MKKIEAIVWLIWFLLIVEWNYGFPEASPFLDVLVSTILFIFNVIILRFIKI